MRFLLMIASFFFLSCEQEIAQQKNTQNNSVSAEVQAMQVAKNVKYIKGQVSYREKIALPPGSILTVTLEDVSKMDAASTKITTKSKVLKKQPPYRFQLPYDKTKIKDKFRYNIRAKIENNGRLLFTSTEHLDPFSDSESLTIILSKVNANRTQALASSHSVPVAGTQWKLIELQGKPVEDEPSWQPYWVIDDTQKMLSGFAGCNHFSGSYKLTKETIYFSQIALTKKMCIKNMELESEFIKIFEKPKKYEVKNNQLLIYQDGRAIAIFKARN